MRKASSVARSGWSAAPAVPWTQWSGHRVCSPQWSRFVSNGFASWVEAKDACSAGCQSWVTTTWPKRRASALTSGTIESPSSTASAPPGMKSACRSITSRTSLSSISIAEGMRTDSLQPHEGAPPVPLEGEDDAERENERQDQIEQPEHQERGHHIGLRHIRHSFEKRDLQNAEAARGVTHERERKGRQKDAEHYEEAGIGRGWQSEKDNAGRADEFERPRQQLSRRDRGARIDEFEAAELERAKMQERPDDKEGRRGEQNDCADPTDPQRRAVEALDEFGPEEQEEAAEHRRAEREGERAEGDQHANLGDAEPLGRIGAVADDRAREDGGADIVGDGVGGERRQGDESPAQPPAEMKERDLVVPGERRIGERGGGDRSQPAGGRDRGDRIAQAGERQSVQFLEQKPGRYGHRAQSDDRPRDVLNPPLALFAGHLTSHAFGPSLPEQGREGKAGAGGGRAARTSELTLAVSAARGHADAPKNTRRIMPDREQASTGTQDYVGDPRNDSVLISVNGTLTPRAEAKVSVFDSGFVLGDGVWEGLRLAGGRIGFFSRHLDRLWDGAKMLKIDIGLDRSTLKTRLFDVIDANHMTDGVHIRLMVTRGVRRSPYQDPRLAVGAATIVVVPEWKLPRPEMFARGLNLFTVHIRRTGPAEQDQKLNSHSKLNCILACIQAMEAGADEALMLDDRGFVATCNSTHFFIVRGGEVWTSAGGYCLGGITRGAVLRAARREGIPAFEKDFSLFDVYGADEAFTTGTFAGLTPVVRVDGRAIGDGARAPDDASGPVTRRLRAAVKALESEESEGRMPP